VIAAVSASSARLQAAIDELQTADLAELSDSVLCEQTITLRHQIDQLEAAFSHYVEAAHLRGAAAAGGYLSTAAFLRHAIHLTPGAARNRVDVAAGLREHPGIAADFRAGLISHGHAAILTEALATLPTEVAADAEPVLREAARHLDMAKLREVVRRLRHIADPDGQAGIDARHQENRWFDIASTFSGMIAITGMLDPETGATLRAAINSLDAPGTDDSRTASTRRADALGELARRALDRGDLPNVGGEQPHVNITVDYASLRNQPGAPPAEMEWAGPIGNDTARRISCDASITRILYTTDPDLAAEYRAAGRPGPPLTPRPPVKPGSFATPDLVLAPEALLTPEILLPPEAAPTVAHSGSNFWQALPPPMRARSLPLDIGRASRLANAAQRTAANLRDGGCAIPSCDRPPSWCDLHHIVHWIDGGQTCLQNLCLLCRRHHKIVHDEHWILTLLPDGTLDAQQPAKPSLVLAGSNH
jgi:hypothetical protein